jgi:hypothetical protein
VDGTGTRVFERNEWVRVLLATVSGLLPRLATGCGKAADVDFDIATRTYTVISLTMYARGQTMVPGSVVVCTCRYSTGEMYSRGSAAARRRGRSTRSRERTRSCSSRSLRERVGKSSARRSRPRSGTARYLPLDSCLPPSLCFFYWPTPHKCNPAQRYEPLSTTRTALVSCATIVSRGLQKKWSACFTFAACVSCQVSLGNRLLSLVHAPKVSSPHC